MIELINLNSELSQSGMLPEVTAYYRRHEIWPHDHRSQPVMGVVSDNEISDLVVGFNHRHSPCIVKAAQKYGFAQRFCFIISSCAARIAAAGRIPSFSIPR